jgi:hypothetical protein
MRRTVRAQRPERRRSGNGRIDHGLDAESWNVFLSVDFLPLHELLLDYQARLASALAEAKIHKVLMK